MCGIVSIFSYGADAPPVDQAELLRIRDRMTARGRTAAGPGIPPMDGWASATGGWRSWIFLRAAPNPMFTPDGRFGIVFNGEIYNYRELRAKLEQNGYRFRYTSDTEALFHLYAEKSGGEMVHDLRGMVVFSIWGQGVEQK
jgi:asparagine synthase (glutamine-hydrolysing)